MMYKIIRCDLYEHEPRANIVVEEKLKYSMKTTTTRIGGVNVQEDENGKYVDFTNTGGYKHMGILRIEER